MLCFDLKKRHIKGEKKHCSNVFCKVSQKMKRFREQQSFLWSNSTKWT